MIVLQKPQKNSIPELMLQKYQKKTKVKNNNYIRRYTGRK